MTKKIWNKIKDAFYLNRLGKGCDNDFVYELIEQLEVEAKRQVFNDIEKAVKKNENAPFIMWVDDFHSKKKKMCITAVQDYWDLKKRHLSTFEKQKGYNSGFKKSAKSMKH